jgi:streptogramin lyase
LAVESLENRWLLSGGVFEYALPSSPDRRPYGITSGPDNNLWFTEQFADKIGRYNPVSNLLTEFNLAAGRQPFDIASGPDGNLWFTETGTNKVGRMTTTGTLLGEFAIPSGGVPYGITAGPDGRLWMTEFVSNTVSKIVRMTTAGVSNPSDEFTIPTSGPGIGEIARGPGGDNNLWFVEFNASANKIGRINATTGTITEFAIPTAGAGPEFITAGPDGRLWFTEEMASKVARITTAGVITGADEFPIPGASGLDGITTGPDGNLWFGEYFTRKVGRISTSGTNIKDYAVPNANSATVGPNALVKGSDNNIWFTKPFANSLGKLVPDRPLTGVPKTFTPTEGSEFTGVVASFTDADPGAAAGDFTARIEWGNGNVSMGLVAPSGGSFTVTGINAYGEEGSYAVKVTITDINDTNDTGGSTVIVNSTANVADGAISAIPITFIYPVGTEGFAINNLILANFVDGGGTEPLGTYTTTIDWGDGTAPTAGTLNQVGLIVTVAGSHTYAEEDPRTIKVTIKDEGGATAMVSVPITLYDAPLVATAVPVSATEGALFSGPVATFIDTGGPEVVGDYSASINWNDGSAPTPGTITFSAGTFTISGTHTYTEEDNYVVSITLVHEGTGPCLFETTARVADAALSVSANSVNATEGAVFQGVVASFSDAATLESAGHYSVSIDWGDGNVSAGTLTANGGGGYDISGNNTYAEEGSYTVTVTVLDEGGASSTVTGTATVGDAALSAFSSDFAGNTGVALTNVPLAYFADAGGPEPTGNYTVSIDWGDLTGLDPTGVINANGSLFQVTGSHTYAAAGVYTVTVTITDDGGSSVAVNPTGTITDPGPSPGMARGGRLFDSFGAAPGLSTTHTISEPSAGQGDASGPSAAAARQAADIVFSDPELQQHWTPGTTRRKAWAVGQPELWDGLLGSEMDLAPGARP